jgi:hypothetical protein
MKKTVVKTQNTLFHVVYVITSTQGHKANYNYYNSLFDCHRIKNNAYIRVNCKGFMFRSKKKIFSKWRNHSRWRSSSGVLNFKSLNLLF